MIVIILMMMVLMVLMVLLMTMINANKHSHTRLVEFSRRFTQKKKIILLTFQWSRRLYFLFLVILPAHHWQTLKIKSTLINLKLISRIYLKLFPSFIFFFFSNWTKSLVIIYWQKTKEDIDIIYYIYSFRIELATIWNDSIFGEVNWSFSTMGQYSQAFVPTSAWLLIYTEQKYY